MLLIAGKTVPRRKEDKHSSPLHPKLSKGKPLPSKHAMRLAVLPTVWGSGQTGQPPSTGGAQRFR